MVERTIELRRRYNRKKKMAKLKRKLARTKDNSEKVKFLAKIRILSPWWKPKEAAAKGSGETFAAACGFALADEFRRARRRKRRPRGFLPLRRRLIHLRHPFHVVFPFFPSLL